MDTIKVGNAISFLRKRAGYTQKDLATRIGISDKAVSKWERGISLPDISILGKLSILLDTDTDSLLSGDVIHHDKKWGGILKIDGSPSGIHAGTMIFDKPVVYYLLGYFMLVGIRNICIKCDEISKDFISKAIGNGEQYGISLTFDDFSEEFSNYLVVAGRSIIYGVDQTRFFQRAMLYTNHFTVLSIPKGMRKEIPELTFNTDKKVVDVGNENQVVTQYNYYTIPIFFCTHQQLKSMGGVNNLSLDFFETIDCVYTEVLDRGFVELPINTWEEVQEASAFVRIVQKACGMEIYCLEEIAWRRGLISTEQFRQFGIKQKDSPIGEYILGIVRREKL